MSAIEQLPLPSTCERRRAERKHLDRVLPVNVGRCDGVFVDVSMRGAKIRHKGALRRGATVRITFEWNRQRFSASAEVLASRVVALGVHADESTTYESRFRYVSMSLESSGLLVRVLAAIGNEELRSWVGNLKGFDDGPRPLAHVVDRCSGYIRCRPLGLRWEKKWTRDPVQPPDGFALPAGTDPADVDSLCRAWGSMDHDARRLVQLTAAAIVDDASSQR